MKKLLIQAVTLIALLCFHSCSNEEEVKQPQLVEFSIDYNFSSGNMLKTTNDEIYTKFFNDYIKTRKITPNNYSLTFIESQSKQKTDITGVWTSKNTIRLLEGTYTVNGTSINNCSNSYVRDSLALSFDDMIEINNQTEQIKIKAVYACSLILFDASNIKSIKYYCSPNYGSTINEPLSQLNGYFYGFVKSFLTYETSYIEVTRKNDKTIKIHTKGLNLENGKYYFFNDMTGGFDLEPMTPGN